MFDATDQLGVNALRMLSINAIQKANSGHPGLPMGCAPMAYTLWTKHLKVNPKTAEAWADRDRFVLSAGHGSALLYSLLHLSGFDVTIDDLKAFRQYESKTPGHPEVHHTSGVEATTGPLGQGLAMAVGMAMAEAHLAATYNKEGHQVVDHYTYALCGDGDLMEGISQEAASLAGHLKLGKLVVLYDSNDISLDGPTDKAFTENVQARFQALGWQTLFVEDGTDMEAIDEALKNAKTEAEKPTLIEVKTQIGYGAPQAGTSAVHGAPIGEEGIAHARKVYNWQEEAFAVPAAVYKRFEETVLAHGKEAEADWQADFAAYEKAYPKLAKRFVAGFKGELPENLADVLPTYEEGDTLASRAASSEIIQALSKAMPQLWGGSADLASSNKTMSEEEEDFSSENYAGRNIWFGVREFAMAAAMNGIDLHGGTRVYGGTFFVFVDYLRAALRLAAIQGTGAIYVLTHDSIAVGEDGPTHEPIEQLASVRAMPNVNVLRPADGNETAAAWLKALETTDKPTLLVLSRQGLPTLPKTKDLAPDHVAKGAYIISEAKAETPSALVIATGSEVKLALDAKEQLGEAGEDVQIVSMPSFELFEEQDDDYQEKVLPGAVTKRLAVEMGSPFGWERYVGREGKILGIDTFGASAPGNVVQEKYGFTPAHVAKALADLLDQE